MFPYQQTTQTYVQPGVSVQTTTYPVPQNVTYIQPAPYTTTTYVQPTPTFVQQPPVVIQENVYQQGGPSFGSAAAGFGAGLLLGEVFGNGHHHHHHGGFFGDGFGGHHHHHHH